MKVQKTSPLVWFFLILDCEIKKFESKNTNKNFQ